MYTVIFRKKGRKRKRLIHLRNQNQSYCTNQITSFRKDRLSGFAIYGGLITSVYNITQGREKENLMATTVSAIINCGLNLYMIPKYSLYGAAFTTLLSELFVFVFCTLRAPNKKRFFDVDEIKNSILYAVVGSILVLLTTKVVYMLVECSALLRLIIAVALSAVVYITYLIIFKNKYTIDIVRNIMVKIKKKY